MLFQALRPAELQPSEKIAAGLFEKLGQSLSLLRQQSASGIELVVLSKPVLAHIDHMVDDYFATLFQSYLQRVPNTCTRQFGEVCGSDELFEFRHRILLLHYGHPTISRMPINRQERYQIRICRFF